MRTEMQVAELIFEPFKRTNVSDMAVSSLLDMIRRRVLRPGDRLPSQRDLMGRMGVSQTAIREALRSLTSIGVIEVHPGKGAFVKSVAPEMLVHPESMFFLLQRETMLHALEVRQILEVEAIALATERVTEDDLEELRQTLGKIETGVRTGDRPFQYSPFFHLAIARAAHNEVLTNMVQSFVRLLLEGANLIGPHAPGALENEYRSHALLLDAIVAGDAEASREAMREHLRVARNLIESGFDEFEAQNTSGGSPPN